VLIAASGCLALAAVFAFSAAGKLRQPETFARQVAAYQVVPPAVTGQVAAVLTVLEAGCAVLLAVPPARLPGLVIAGGLLVTFLLAMSAALARGCRIPCGCFAGQGELDLVGLPSTVRTGLLAVLAVVSLPGRAVAFRPAQVMVAALLLALIFLLAELSRLLPPRAAGSRMSWLLPLRAPAERP
jgi:hypothetical protein